MRPARADKHLSGLLIALAVGVPALLCALTVLIGGLGGLFLLGGNTALPGVSVGGVAVGGMAAEDAARGLLGWQIALSDGESVTFVRPEEIGVGIDVSASGQVAVDFGRRPADMGAMLRAAFGQVNVPPTLSYDPAAVEAALRSRASQWNRSPRNAGVQLVGGTVQPRPASDGRALDAAATAANISAESLADGQIELVMVTIPAAITDPAPIVAAAQALLATPLSLRLYDPVQDQGVDLAVPPATWVNWLTALDDPSSSLGVRLQLDRDQTAAWLAAQNGRVGTGRFGAPRTFDALAAADALDDALASGGGAAWAQLRYQPFEHVVAPGESITSIAWDYGVPYPWVERVNPGVSALSVGQSITIPPLDEQIALPVVPNKRIVVSIGAQRVRVYENGALKWDWLASTGIPDSPTWSGVYQIISHEPNAYAGNWNLWMPNFMGVYRPVPGADFTNGFHGFPTRNGGQLLWTNDLGRRVTYGCILLSDTHVAQLYTWAQEGVVVEIQP
jgi:lipoprotein-anchoring transpeptidase ErfK/SrfK